MTRVFPFIQVDDAMSALTFYGKAFGAKPVGDITYYKAFEPDSEYKDLIAHSALQFNEAMLFISDAIDQPRTNETRFTVNVELDNEDLIKNSFNVLSVNAEEIYYEPVNIGWSPLGYSLRDKFGVIWMVYLVSE
jgi:uncharacterized glyoxalase superfamily protein PhnB